MSDVDSFSPGNSVGARLKAAREERGLSLDDIATKTRIPIRHLKAIEDGDWESLPAITYSVGFARSYANVVGLNGAEIGQELREQLGGAQTHSAGAPYEPADPSRVPPRSLAIAAGLLAILLAVGYLIWRSSTVEEPTMLEQATAEQPVPVATVTPVAPPPVAQQPLGGPAAPAAASGPVVLTAISDVWVRVYDGATTGPSLLQRQMQAGESFEVPASAQRPMIRTARAEALRVRVGTTELPQLGPPGAVSGKSLLPQDLLGGGAPAAPPPAAAAPQPAAPLTE
jgi:cytoskeletal protein RodZ